MYSLIRKGKDSILVYLGDEFIIAEQFKQVFAKKIDFLEPKTFNEKLQIQKLYDRNPLMPQLADKFRVREYIEALGYGDILNNLLQSCERPDDIDFEALPRQFVIKCNHSWNANIICKNKLEIDCDATRHQLEIWLSKNHYYKFREWAYRDIKPMIVIERLIPGELKDYKFFCFSGVPKFVQVDSGRYGEHTLDLYDINWNLLNCGKANKNRNIKSECRPEFFDYLKKISHDISSAFNFCRVDFIVANDRFYFGEVTFYPGAGFSNFDPECFDYIFGSELDVSGLKRPNNVRLKSNLIKFFDNLGFI